MPQREFSYVGSDKESESDEDELEWSKRGDSSPSSETGSEDEANPGEGADGANSGERNTVQRNLAGTSGTKGTCKENQNLRWHKRQPVQYNTTYNGELFPPQPDVDITPLQYFKQMFDDQLTDHNIVEQTNLYFV